jgi:hypothetical protein
MNRTRHQRVLSTTLMPGILQITALPPVITGVLLSFILCVFLAPPVPTAAAEDTRTIQIVIPDKSCQAKGDESKDTLVWKLTDSSKDLGYVANFKRDNRGDLVATIESTEKTSKLASKNVSCQGVLETEISAEEFKKGLGTISYSANAEVDNTQKNNAWFNALIDGKQAQGFLPFGPIITKETVSIGSSLDAPESAKTITLSFKLNGLGKASITMVKLGQAHDLTQLKKEPAPTNLDFSKDLTGWQTRHTGEKATLYETVLKEISGSKLAELMHKEGPIGEAVFEQSIVADQFQGKKVTVEADCRACSADTDAKIFILSSPAAGYSDGRWDAFTATVRTYSSKRIADDNWRHYRVSAEIADDSKKFEFGLNLTGGGAVQIKNVQLSDASEKDPGNTPSAALTENQLAALISFSKAYGLVRYFYPHASLNTDSWNNYLLWAVDKLLALAKDEHDQKKILKTVLLPVAPDLVLDNYQSPEASGGPFWKHIGYGADSGRFNAQSRSAIVQNNGKDKPDSATTESTKPAWQKWCGPFPIGDICCWWSADKSLEVKSGLAQECLQYTKNKPQEWAASANDRISRLAVVIAVWNVPRFYYPEQDLMASWSDTLAPALKAASTDPGETTFVRTLQRMVAPLKDDQCRILNNSIDGLGMVSTQYAPHCGWRFIAQKLIITSDQHPLHPFRPVGRSVSRVNNLDLPAIVAAEKPSISAGTERRLMHRLAQSLLLGPLESACGIGWDWPVKAGDSYKVFSAGGSEPRSVPLVCSVTHDGITTCEVTEKRPESFALLEHNIVYVDLTRISPAELEKKMEQICQAGRVILDCRGTLCRGNESIFEHLFKTRPAVPQLKLPVLSGPAETDRSFVDVGFDIRAKQPTISGKVAFLVDERTVGQMELYLAAAEATHAGTFIGSQTAGTAGFVNTAELPAGYILSWTATKTLKPDGSNLNTRGITPNPELRPSEAGIAAFRDELLDAAISQLSK